MTEAKRDNKHKPDLSLLPYVFECDVARVMMFGAAKYGRDNYLSGHKLTGLIASMKRHIGQLSTGQDIDEESGLPHWAHIAANCLMLAHQQQIGTLKDDRYKSPVPAAPQFMGVDVTASPPKSEWQVQARDLKGYIEVLGCYTSKAAADSALMFFAPEWPLFKVTVEEVPCAA